MTVDVVDACVGLLRRTVFRPARPAPAGLVVRLAVGLATAGMLVYAGQKVYMAVRGEIGMPGSPAPDSVQAQFTDAAFAQAVNASLGVVAALVASATVMRWGSRIPRWMLLCALALAFVMQSLGAAITVRRAGLGPAHLGGGAVLDVLWGGSQLAAWLVLTVSYFARTRRTGIRPTNGSAPAATSRVRPAAAYGAFACSLAYGAMKLDWAWGGEFLMRQTPLPRAAGEDLLRHASGAVVQHWASVALALVGMAAALHLSGRFRPHGKVRRGALLMGAWAGCALMVLRAVGALGYGFVNDLRVLTDPALVPPAFADLARSHALWDLVLWSPYWLLFGVCWGVAALRYRRRAAAGGNSAAVEARYPQEASSGTA
ncbi:DUF3995 domain-containing protein [Streptomyces sp. NPDC048506]|uniref:DUF3995 domain-containing protein n=1 Tax=Streptomyces sp. NPDC048506 TaxID=3155028 RepID=UPI00341A7EE7